MIHTMHNATPTAAASQASVVSSRADVRVWNLILAVAALALFAAYLGMNNRAAAKGFAIRTIERRILDLQDEREKLNLSVVTNQSMEALDAKIEGLGMVPVTAIDYVSDDTGAVAVR